jgi:hypothetical protein
LTWQDKTYLAGLGETNNRFSLALKPNNTCFQNNQFAASVIKITLQIRVRVVVGKYNCLKYHRTLIVGLKLLITSFSQRYKNGTVFKFIENSTVSLAYIKSNEKAYLMISFFININIW